MMKPTPRMIATIVMTTVLGMPDVDAEVETAGLAVDGGETGDTTGALLTNEGDLVVGAATGAELAVRVMLLVTFIAS